MQKKHRGLPITGALHLQRSLGCPEVSPRLGGPWGNRWGFALMIRPVLQAGQPRGWAAHLKVRHGRAAVRALMGLLDGLEEVSEHLQVAAGPRIHGSIVWVLLAPAGGMGCPPKQGSWSGLAPRPPPEPGHTCRPYCANRPGCSDMLSFHFGNKNKKNPV